ncbi:oxidoreductase [Glycomyces algeriensis]|uniref:Short-chain dehydrogenase/reductase n=1 Tax=Glycomyces algeriensis TaxID=256037 RepID=A0A9W6GAI7_9ACTN|nr:oxidoreductase [Glycomyces algeriensis]MDA1364614.1 oxidoreductase [Glycomyces algeriensis]MDR7350651.1 NAD(P)-dependent dehydrogenase (short-subunit alcohol dehydrogenase family) [Glycomyces algeriensis]GLI43360.1 putative short-chain dehydrogenase/reductase [Glycomyces algeriensis]
MSSRQWTAADIPDQTGRTVVVTGANSGLGIETARALAGRGAHVIMTARSEGKGRKAAEEIRADHPRANLEVRTLDLEDLDSVAAFADGLVADRNRLDLLVNNAGVMAVPRSLSPQGQERQFATNHLGHFALTGRLLGLLEAGRDPRVVTVSSLAHRSGRIHFEDLTGERRYSAVGFYSQSKFANAVFGLELDRRLRAAGSPVRSLIAHPGFSATKLVDNGMNAPARLITNLIMPFVTQSQAEGALPQLRAATDSKAQGGEYYGPDGKRERKGAPVVVDTIPEAKDRETAARLWTLSEELTGVKFELAAA